jgi:hypothetical protein
MKGSKISAQMLKFLAGLLIAIGIGFTILGIGFVVYSFIFQIDHFPTQCNSLVELGCLKLREMVCVNEDYIWSLSVGCPPGESNGQCGCSLDEVRSQAGMSKEEFLRHCGCLK